MKYTLACFVLGGIFLMILKEHPETLRIPTAAGAASVTGNGSASSPSSSSVAQEESEARVRGHQIELIDAEIRGLEGKMSSLATRRGTDSGRGITMRKYQTQVDALRVQKRLLLDPELGKR